MYEKITLNNGVRIVWERIPYVRSASVGIWVGTGSRFEKKSENGAAHFIEHMAFKGTTARSAADIAELTDEMGGQMNAFTTKEMTCFYGRFLDAHLHLAMDVLCDMFFDSVFSEKETNTERGVILEEISMYQDTPEDLVMERLFTAVFKGSALSRPILGTRATLGAMNGEFLKHYMHENYSGDSVVVALSGSFTDSDLRYLTERFGEVRPGTAKKKKPATYIPAFTVKSKNIEQNHICLGFPGYSVSDERRYAFQLMSSIFGGNMSSRLFQTLREKLGLCYSVSAFGVAHEDVGITCVATALNRETEEKALRAVLEEADKLKSDGVDAKELARAREQIKANVLMSMESTQSRMNRLGRGELMLGRVMTEDETIAAYDAVTAENVREAAEECLNIDMLSFSAVGSVRTEEEYRKIICG